MMTRINTILSTLERVIYVDKKESHIYICSLAEKWSHEGREWSVSCCIQDSTTPFF